MIGGEGGSQEVFAPRYELSTDELNQLTGELIDERTAEYPAEDAVVSVVVAPDDPRSNVARHIERAVFQKYFENHGPDQMAEMYAPYEEASTFFIVLDRNSREAMSSLRVIRNTPAGFMTLNDLEDDFGVRKEKVLEGHGMEDLDQVLDVATVARAEGYKKELRAVTFAYRSMFVWAEAHGMKHLISMIDDGPYRKMREYFGIPFEPILGMDPVKYYGSAVTHPVHGYIPEFIPKMKPHMFTPKGILAHRALLTMVKGRDDRLLAVED